LLYNKILAESLKDRTRWKHHIFTRTRFQNQGDSMAKIVIAEDEPDIRELIAFTLRFAGHEVVTGANGQEGYDLTKTEHPDLAMFDVRMPRMSGYEACRKIKTDPEIAHIPVVFLSAKGQENEIEQGMAAGAEEYLLKPFAPDQLNERIKSILIKFGK